PEGRAAAASAAAAYLTAALDRGGHHLLSALPGAEPGPDFGGTADAVAALAADGHRLAAAEGLRWLQRPGSGALTWAKDDPGALAKLILAAHAAGADPRDFAGTDLVRALDATGRQSGIPAVADAAAAESGDGGSGHGWWYAAGGAATAAAALVLGLRLARRRRA
ncbi:hypothetical protein RKE29_30290, partial [Streptomyces sp. B1866]|nr:hypothetical protein [Streptomyces sp. B1866]